MSRKGKGIVAFRGFIFILSLWISLPAWASGRLESVVQRVELPVSEDDQTYSILTLDDLGVMVVMKQNDLFSARPQRWIYFYDQNLQQRWATALEVESFYNFLGFERESDSMRFFLSSLPSRPQGAAFLDIAVCLADGSYSKHYHEADVSDWEKSSFPFLAPFKDAWHMVVKDRNTYHYLRFEPVKDTLVHWEIGSAREYDLCDTRVDTASERIYLLFRDVRCREKSLFLKVYAFDGNLLHNHMVPPPRSDMRLTDGKLFVKDSSEYWIAGNWNLERADQTVSVYDRGTETMGIYSMRYVNTNFTSVWFKSYLEFPQVDSLLGNKQMYTLQQAKAKSNGRVIMPEYLSQLRLFTQEGQVHLLAEVYDRLLNTTTDVTYDFYGRMVPYTRTTFDGYRYENAFYVVFDSTQVPLQTSVFDLEQSSDKQNMCSVSAVVRDTSGRILYAYNDKGIVYFRSMNAYGGITQVRSFRLESLYQGDRINKSWGEGMAYWYKGNFLAFGYEQVSNSRRKGKSRQNIFYMNRVVLK